MGNKTSMLPPGANSHSQAPHYIAAIAILVYVANSPGLANSECGFALRSRTY